MRPVLVATAFGVLAFGLLTGARADVFLVKGGGRVHGTVDEEFSDEFGTKWLRVKTPFGNVDLRKADLQKKVKSKGDRGTLYLTEARIYGMDGVVEKSSDDGDTWTRIPWKVGKSGTVDTDEFPPRIRAGERVRTGEAAYAELDIGWGVVHVDAESELEVREAKGATVGLLRGRMGARVDETPKGAAFRVETPQASMGVRGTTFVVEISGASTHVAVGEGTVRVEKNDVSGDEAVDAAPGAEPATVEVTDRDRSWLDRVTKGRRYPPVEWAVIPGGKFTMGGPPLGGPPNVLTPSPQTVITVKPFLMARLELTERQIDEYRVWEARYPEVVVPPVSGFNWKVWQRTRSDPPIEKGEPVIANYWLARTISTWLGASLPSESQWERAARGGTDTTFYWGDDESEARRFEWMALTSGDRPLEKTELQGNPGAVQGAGCRTHEVGERPPNPFGLHDIMGNVSEWCLDSAAPTLAGIPTDGSPRMIADSPQRVCRGSNFGWGPYPVYRRFQSQPERAFGIRLTRPLEQD